MLGRGSGWARLARRWQFWGLVLPALCWALAAGCASSPSTDPWSTIRDDKRPISRRIQAADALGREANSPERTARAREALKSIAWDKDQDPALRQAALRNILNQRESDEDSRGLAIAMLPQEPNVGMIAILSDACGERGWREATASLVRSYARESDKLTDEQRPERSALVKLHPGATIGRIVMDVFLSHGTDPTNEQPPGQTRRVRTAAWDLLARLDQSGQERLAMLAATPTPGSPVVAQLHRCASELWCVPVTGEEVAWLGRLLDASNPGNAAWWMQASACVSKLTPEQRVGLRLRHIEAVRWASTQRPEWLGMDRAGLLARVETSLRGRPRHQRQAPEGGAARATPEALAHWAPGLSWADLLTMLVVDEALAQTSGALRGQIAADREDRTTEHGGILRWDGQWIAQAFVPRPAQRMGDDQFIAPAEMIEQSDLALAHYHFHVQRSDLAKLAGPSPEDLAYARRFGRTCVVLTMVRPGVVGVDLYEHDQTGRVIDLGELAR